MLVPEPIKTPLGGMALLLVTPEVLSQPLIDDLGKAVQPGALDGRRPPIPWRRRIDHHLVHAIAQNPKIPRYRALAHALLAIGKPNLPIKLHGENSPALPGTRKAKSGRLLSRPELHHATAPVADFLTAVLTRSNLLLDCA